MKRPTLGIITKERKPEKEPQTKTARSPRPPKLPVWPEADGFRLFLAQRRGRQSTKQATRKQYVEMLRMIDRATGLDPIRIPSYLAQLIDQGRSASWINKVICLLHLYGEYKKTDAYRQFRIIEGEAPQKSVMSDKEIEALIDLPGKMKWRMFFAIAAYSGMRPGEVASLTVQSVDLGRGIFNADGKTGPRQVPIAPAIATQLERYLKDLSGEYLFPGTSGRPVTRQAWHLQFTNRLERLGIKRPGLTAHSLRHSFITRMLGEDVNLFKVQKIVGHKKIETAAMYTHLTTKDIINAIRKDPLGRQFMTPREIVQQTAAMLRALAETGDDRFAYEFHESSGKLSFSLEARADI